MKLKVVKLKVPLTLFLLFSAPLARTEEKPNLDLQVFQRYLLSHPGGKRPGHPSPETWSESEWMSLLAQIQAILTDAQRAIEGYHAVQNGLAQGRGTWRVDEVLWVTRGALSSGVGFELGLGLHGDGRFWWPHLRIGTKVFVSTDAGFGLATAIVKREWQETGTRQSASPLNVRGSGVAGYMILGRETAQLADTAGFGRERGGGVGVYARFGKDTEDIVGLGIPLSPIPIPGKLFWTLRAIESLRQKLILDLWDLDLEKARRDVERLALKSTAAVAAYRGRLGAAALLESDPLASIAVLYDPWSAPRHRRTIRQILSRACGRWLGIYGAVGPGKETAGDLD